MLWIIIIRNYLKCVVFLSSLIQNLIICTTMGIVSQFYHLFFITVQWYMMIKKPPFPGRRTPIPLVLTRMHIDELTISSHRKSSAIVNNSIFLMKSKRSFWYSNNSPIIWINGYQLMLLPRDLRLYVLTYKKQ